MISRGDEALGPTHKSFEAIRSIEYDRLDPDEDEADTMEAMRLDAEAFFGEQKMDREKEE